MGWNANVGIPFGGNLMLILYVILLHIATVIGFYFLWDPMFLPLIVIGNIMISVIGGEIFYHRYVSHSSFTCNERTKWFMVVMSLFSGLGGPLGWAIQHRHHHWHSDTDKDPHMVKDRPIRMWFCPNNIRGDWLEPDGCWDLLNKPMLQFLQKWYWYFHVVLVTLVMLIDIKIAFYLIIVPNLLAIHQHGAVNVLGHGYGYRNFDTPDHSTNSRWLSLLTYGNHLHNNHHAFPWSYTSAVKDNEFDLTALIIKKFLAIEVKT